MVSAVRETAVYTVRYLGPVSITGRVSVEGWVEQVMGHVGAEQVAGVADEGRVGGGADGGELLVRSDRAWVEDPEYRS